VAGIVGANGQIRGIGNEANLISLKVFPGSGRSGATTTGVKNAIDWCVDNSNVYNISVITLSLGTNYSYLDSTSCESDFPSLTTSITNAFNQNISVTISSGNDANITGISGPACISKAIPIGATYDSNVGSKGWGDCTDPTTSLDMMVCFTNRNSLVKLLAPGSIISSTDNDGIGYVDQSGTSMAAPMVAGAIAIVNQYLSSESTSKTPWEIENVLNQTGKQIYDSESGFTYSRIDVLSAIKELDVFNPDVNLLSPGNDSQLTNINQTFTCNATDVQLTNITLYIWNESGIHNTISVNISNNQNITFNQTLSLGNYTWNCLAIDEKGNNSFATTNYTLEIYDDNLNINNEGEDLKQMIVIGIDGFQYNHYVEMLEAGDLGNFTRLISNGGWNGTHNITGHEATYTKPGNAEVHTGLNETYNLVSDNDDPDLVPNGTTTFERLAVFNSSIALGSIYGKTKTYLPNGVIGNAIEDIDWWHNQTTYASVPWVDGTACDNSINVATKATEFISTYNESSFYLFVYFGVPDCSGHVSNDSSIQYNNSFINVDSGLGVLLNYLENNSLNDSVQIIVTVDHGWNEGTNDHYTTNYNTAVLPLITNNKSLIANITSDNVREQCEIAPTTLDYFDVPKENYSDIINNGCDSMIGELNPPIISSLSTVVTTTSATISFLTNEYSNISVDYGINTSLISNFSNSTFSENHSVTFSSLPSSTLHYYNLTVCDNLGNCNTTGNYNFTTSTPVTNPPSSSSSSGGGGGGTLTYRPTITELKNGYTKNLKIREKIIFKILNESHTLTINSIEEKRVNLIIQSEPIDLTLYTNIEKKINLTNKDYYDVNLKVNEIENKFVNLTIKSIYEPIKENLNDSGNKINDSTNNQINDSENIVFEIKDNDKNYSSKTVLVIIFISLFILILFIFIIIYLLKKLNKNRQVQKKIKIKKDVYHKLKEKSNKPKNTEDII
jgi:hypothetical protein